MTKSLIALVSILVATATNYAQAVPITVSGAAAKVAAVARPVVAGVAIGKLIFGVNAETEAFSPGNAVAASCPPPDGGGFFRRSASCTSSQASAGIAPPVTNSSAASASLGLILNSSSVSATKAPKGGGGYATAFQRTTAGYKTASASSGLSSHSPTDPATEATMALDLQLPEFTLSSAPGVVAFLDLDIFASVIPTILGNTLPPITDDIIPDPDPSPGIPIPDPQGDILSLFRVTAELLGSTLIVGGDLTNSNFTTPTADGLGGFTTSLILSSLPQITVDGQQYFRAALFDADIPYFRLDEELTAGVVPEPPSLLLTAIGIAVIFGLRCRAVGR